MRQLFILCIILSFYGFYGSGLYSQVCNPDPLFTGEGISPDTTDNMPLACVPIPYSATFTVHPPPDTIIGGITFTINFLRIDSVVGLPLGFTYACSPVNCTYPGGAIGCAIVTGIPTLALIGLYPLTIYGTIQLFHPIFGTITQPVIFSDYRLKIGGGMGFLNGSTDAGCGLSNGSVWTLVSGGVSPLSYVWNTLPVSTNDTVLNLSVGNYQVNVTDYYGCMDSTNVNVANPNSPVIDTIIGTHNACFGDTIGTAISVVSMGNAPYTYSWSNSDTTDTIINLSEGTYILIVTDSSNCSSLMEAITITAPTILNSVMLSTSETCIGCLDGSASVSVSGGTPPYSYLWSNSATTDTITGISTGIYIVTVTDSMGCILNDTVMVNSTAGIHENNLSKSAVIYPNPAKELIKIESTIIDGEGIKIEITDIRGTLIANFETKQKLYSIDVHTWPVGIYLIRIYISNLFEVHKLIIN